MFLSKSKNFMLLRLLLVSFVAFALPGCAKYSPKSLGPSLGEEQELDGIVVAAHTLSYNDAKRIFSRDIEKKDYKAIQLSITNHSDNTYLLHGSSISLNLEPVRYVARDMQLNAAKRTLMWAVPGFLLLPVLFPLVYVGIVDGCKSLYANRQLSHDFVARCIDRHSNIYLQPGKTVNKIMFVSRDNFYKKLTLKIESLHEERKDLLYKIAL